ncbi:MAG: helix-turn-helix transcriptional regulator, partial [Clostridia bacterium]|nr:helix-turn-helix transcriptional regulator [Clostridia bacterium]
YRMENEYNPLIERLYKRDDAPFGCSQMTKNLLEVFLIMLSRNKIVSTKPERKSYLIDGVAVPSDVKAIIDYMKEHLYESLTIMEIANVLNRSESYTKKIFSKYYEGGIIKYFNSMKIKEARRLIRNGEYSMEQISNMLGFDSPQYFSRCFKQFTRLSPLQYKKSIIR